MYKSSVINEFHSLNCIVFYLNLSCINRVKFFVCLMSNYGRLETGIFSKLYCVLMVYLVYCKIKSKN